MARTALVAGASGLVGGHVLRRLLEDAFRKVDLTYVVELARVAARHRASQVLVVTALGANPNSRVFYSRVKGETEAAVRRLPFDGIHIFRPSFLLGARVERRRGEWLAALLTPLVSWALVGPLARYRPIHATAVARAMLRVACDAAGGVHVYESDAIRRLAAR